MSVYHLNYCSSEIKTIQNLIVDFYCRENELLKHQLKKYVSAVQMLRSQNGSMGTGKYRALQSRKILMFVLSPERCQTRLNCNHCPVVCLDIGVKSEALAIPPQRTTIDYSHEASEYERKLIQVKMT